MTSVVGQLPLGEGNFGFCLVSVNLYVNVLTLMLGALDNEVSCARPGPPVQRQSTLTQETLICGKLVTGGTCSRIPESKELPLAFFLGYSLRLIVVTLPF